MIATILGILLFLYMMLSINHSDPKPPNSLCTDEQVYRIATGRASSEEVLAEIRSKQQKKLPASPTSTIPESVVPLDEPEIVYKNIAKNHPTPLNWFLCPHPDLPAPSVAEQMIINELNRYKVKWYREVSFYGLQTSKYGWPRYDFWVPSHNLIIEYDGIYHSRPEVKTMDKLKNQFCKDNRISIKRYNRKHYYSMDKHIASLMTSHHISKK